MTDGIRIERCDPADEAVVRACADVFAAALHLDDPGAAVMGPRALRGWLRLGFTGDPAEAWLARDTESGGVAGWYRLELPDLENTSRAELLIMVDPGARRHGTGRALLRHAAQRADAAGRTVLGGEVRDGRAGDAFAAAAGAEPGLPGIYRRLDLRTLPPGKLAALRAEAAAAAAGYSLVRWSGPTPPEYREALAGVVQAYEDAPRDEGVQREAWDASRVDRSAAATVSMGVRGYMLTAVHDATGEMAAMTEVAIEHDDPHWAHQGLTAVARAHRGHRLGLLLKTEMLDWLAIAEPAVEQVETGNAAANSHMIRVNDAVGFVAVQPHVHNVELKVADALGR